MKKDRTVGLVSLVVGIIACIGTLQIKTSAAANFATDPGPRLFPMIASILLMVCGIGLIVKKQEDEEPFLTAAQWKRLALLAVVFVAYVVGLNFVGFVISTPFMLYATMTMFAGENKLPLWAKLVYSVGVTAVVYLLFVVVFKANIPLGTLTRGLFL